MVNLLADFIVDADFPFVQSDVYTARPKIACESQRNFSIKRGITYEGIHRFSLAPNDGWGGRPPLTGTMERTREKRGGQNQPGMGRWYDKSPAPDVTVLVAKQGGSQFARVCYLVVMQVTETESHIAFKIIEFGNDSLTKDSLIGLLNFPGTRNYVLLIPPRPREWTQPEKLQIQEGIQMLTERIQKAIGRAPPDKK